MYHPTAVFKRWRHGEEDSATNHNTNNNNNNNNNTKRNDDKNDNKNHFKRWRLHWRRWLSVRLTAKVREESGRVRLTAKVRLLQARRPGVRGSPGESGSRRGSSARYVRVRLLLLLLMMMMMMMMIYDLLSK
jgi:hypothetical protein